MRKFFLPLIFIFASCTPAKRSTDRFKSGDKTFISGNFSGTDYIVIQRKEHGIKRDWITIDCNHYIPGMGKTLYMSKQVYDIYGELTSTMPFIKDSVMLNNISSISKSSHHTFSNLSNEELDAINIAFDRFSYLVTKYKLSTDNLKSYLGWLEK
jgi:hypothetical protein